MRTDLTNFEGTTLYVDVPVDSPDGRCNCSVVSIVLVSQNLERKKSRERSENDTPYDNPRLTTDFRCIFERALYSVFRGPSKSDKRRLYTQTRARSATDAKLGSSAAGRKVLIEYRLQYCIFTENPAFFWDVFYFRFILPCIPGWQHSAPQHSKSRELTSSRLSR
ncbi:Pectate lyase L [Fusarium oxysporum f. sp. albedinis]|nr:Pectate lyase L [Fusarium oxysporum f. sp. albedinis]